jgi:CubicO group peptidase (beta-lactamase class C family)
MMKNLAITLIICIILGGCFASSDKRIVDNAGKSKVPAGAGDATTLPKAEFDKYYKVSESFYDLYLKPSGFNGAMLVAKNGQIVYEKYSGFKTFELKDSLDMNTPFHLASVSKTFTGMAVCKLWEDGKLSIDDEVSKFLAGFNYPGITVKTLLNHRSGLPNYVHVMEEKGWDKDHGVTNQDVLNFLIENKKKLSVGRPDRNFTYCNTNYALLALVIEKVSGMKYNDFLRTTFFEPLGMKNTFVYAPELEHSVLPSYNWKKQKEPFTYLDIVYGDKNIYSTTRDLLKWDIALTTGNIFKPETLAAAYSGYSFERKGVKNYGLGWRLYLYPDNKKIVYHNGWWHGNNTVFTRLVDDSATVIILGNKYNRRIYDAKKLYTAFGNYDGDGVGGED